MGSVPIQKNLDSLWGFYTSFATHSCEKNKNITKLNARYKNKT